jgi:hypothetical protein
MRRSAGVGREVARPVTELRRLSSSAHAILADVGNGLVDCMMWVKEADKIDKHSGELSGHSGSLDRLLSTSTPSTATPVFALTTASAIL